MDNVRDFQFENYGYTVINPISILILIFAIVLQLTMPKRYLPITIIITASIIPVMQRIVIAGVDLTIVRILYFITFIRIFLKNEHLNFRLLKIDYTVLLYALINAVIFIIQWNGSMNSIINRLAHILESFGVYIIYRITISDRKDLQNIYIGLALVSVIVALSMSYEQFTGRNLFSIFGGVPEFTPIREGKLRSQGAFSHPIIAGVYGALLIPTLWGLIDKNISKNSRYILIIGIISGIIILYASASSTPLIAFITSLLLIILWPRRTLLPLIAFYTILSLLIIQLFMKAPIWFLMAKIDLVGGSTGYFRAYLFDQFVQRFSSWVLIGTRTTMNWGWGLEDVTNQYVLEGINGGGISLLLFCSIFFQAFRLIIKTIYYLDQDTNRIKDVRLIYSLGVVLFSTVVIFMAVSYFGNMHNYLYLTLATTVCLYQKEIYTSKFLEH